MIKAFGAFAFCTLALAAPVLSQTADDFRDGWAVQNSSDDVFLSMIEAGGDVNGLLGNGDRPLHIVLRVSSAAKAIMLLDHGADVTLTNASGETPLHLAAQSNYLDLGVVQRIIDAGADVNARDANGATPYDVAETYGSWAIRDLLASEGGRAFATDPKDSLQEPLALAFSDPAVIGGSGDGYFQEMVQAGADVNTLLPDGDRPLHVVLRAASRFKSNLLLDHGADVTAANDLGETPLHAASQSDYLGADIVERLIALGAEVNAKDHQGQTPLDVAVAYSSMGIADTLRAHGASSGLPETRPEETQATAPSVGPIDDAEANTIVNIDLPGASALERVLREGGDTSLTQQERAVAGGLALALLDCPLAIEGDERAALAAFATTEAIAAPLGHGDAYTADLDSALASIFQGTIGASTGMMAGAALGCGGDSPTIIARRILRLLGYYD